MITIICPLLLATSNPLSLKDLAPNNFIKTVLNRSLAEFLSQVAPDKVSSDVREFLREALIQRYRILTDSYPSTVLVGHTDYISSVAFSPDGKCALTGSSDDTARLWDIQDINTNQSYVLNGHTCMVI
jgi:WD40 repeat protein